MSSYQWFSTNLIVVFFFCSSLVLPSHGSSQEATDIGYGYVVSSVAVDSNLKVLTANLDLIKPSSIYGPDVTKLSLDVSLETSERLRIRVTDSTQQKWEIPESVIPRAGNHSPRRFLAEDDGGNSSGNNFLGDPSSDIVFTLHNTTPFGFSVSRRSSGDILFDTSPDPSAPDTYFIFKDQFLQLSSALPENRSN